MDEDPARTPKTSAEIRFQKEIGSRLKAARVAAGLTQSQAGEKIGIGKAGISLWEKGERAMDVVKIVALADLYQVTSDSVIMGGPTLATTKDAQRIARQFDLLPPKYKDDAREFIEDKLTRVKSSSKRTG